MIYVKLSDKSDITILILAQSFEKVRLDHDNDYTSMFAFGRTYFEIVRTRLICRQLLYSKHYDAINHNLNQVFNKCETSLCSFL